MPCQIRVGSMAPLCFQIAYLGGAMASSTHSNLFPGETSSYREARNQLLEAETMLRKNLEDVAALRRKLPLGGEIPEDYIFDEGASDLDDSKTVRQTRFSELFQP